MAKATLDSVPIVRVCPPLRCSYRGEFSDRAICGAIATRKRPGAHWFADQYFCSEHAEPSDLAIAGELAVRRLRMEVEVQFAAAVQDDSQAKAEAVGRLERAVHEAGGELELYLVVSDHVRYPAVPGPNLTRRPSGIPK